MDKLRIIVGGFIGLYPTGGVTWDYIQYPVGLSLLGHDVYYLEDTVQFPKYQKEGKEWDDASDSIEYLKNTMEKFGLKDRWAYRDVASGECYGMPLEKLQEICRTADVFINISASTYMRDEYLAIPKRILIDSDPMFTQIEYNRQRTENTEQNRHRMDYLVQNHNYHFTFGENMGKEDCRIPTFNIDWIPTRQPVCLSLWMNKSTRPRKNVMSTVMNWSVSPPLCYDNTTWGQKNSEVEKFMTLPSGFDNLDFELMIANLPTEKKSEMQNAGWKILDPLTGVTNADDYQDFILSSAAEFSVAKETYVKSNSGWFSCRSACYLAAGRPVITQETGWSKYIPSGNGLFAFSDMHSAVEALDQLLSGFEKHSKRAQEISIEYFDSNKVLTQLIERLN